MKKFGIIAILLLAVTLGGVATAHFVVNGNQYDMTIKETTLSGDKTEANGITLHMQFRDLKSQVSFAAAYSTTEEKVYNSDKMKKSDASDLTPHISIEFEEPSYGVYDSSEVEDTQDVAKHGEQKTGIPASEIIKQIDIAEKGRKTEHTFTVSDYLEYLPVILLDYNLPDDINLVEAQSLSDYLQIPVPNRLKGSLKIAKDKLGNVQSWMVDFNADEFDVESSGVYDKDALYIAISGLSFGKEADTTTHYLDMPTKTHGIHYIPLDKQGKSYILDVEKASCLYPLEKNEQVLHLDESASGLELLLYTKLNNYIRLSVINKESMECIQHLSLGNNPDLLDTIIDEDNFLLLLDKNRNFVLIDITDDKYTERFCGSFEKLPSSIYDAIYDADYNGEKLAFVTCPYYDMEGAYTFPYYYTLQIFTDDGLVYSGTYESSLTAINQPLGVYIDDENNPVDVSFNDKTD